MPASGKTHFGCKSPATGGYGDSNMGGHFGPALKYAGYDMMILTGRAAVPSLLVIEDEKVVIRPASELWEMGSLSAETRLKEALGEDFQILTIGPAGENMVVYACITHDFGRQAGRVGIGAVLGSKNIKAVAVKGTGSIRVEDPKALLEAGKRAYRDVRAKPGFTGWTPEGTAGITDWINRVGAFPTKNFQTSYWDQHAKINGAAILRELKITDKGCYCCPTPCGKYGKAKTGLGEVYVEGPEFETISLLGSNCLIGEISEVAYANYVCDELGLDTISAGVVCSWAIECYEKGLLDRETIGKDVQFGDLASVVHLLECIARREGVGNVAAAGFGVVTPFCSCSAVPVFIGFVAAGVPLGITMSFLIASPMVNEVAVILIFGLFGWKVAAAYVVFGLIVAIVAGYLIGRLRLEKWVEPFVYETTLRGDAVVPSTDMPWADRLAMGWEEVRSIVGKIWPYLLIGIGIGAVIHGWAPEDFFASLAGSGNPFVVPLAVVLGIPLYSSAAGIVPLAGALVDKGVQIGTVLAFMMAVVALSLPEMILLKRVLRSQLLATFVAILGTGIIAAGYLFNAII
jgi:uncharacterized membrane protein YraQ (UPF0718 family)